MQLKLIGISKRGKERIEQHGNTFVLIRKTNDGKAFPLLQANENSILVESLNKTFNKGTEKWLGWFEVGKDVDIVEEKS